MSTSSAVLLYSAHPAVTALTAETTLAARSPRTRVLPDVRAEVERAHALVLAGDHAGAAQVYHAVRTRIFRLLHAGGPTPLAGVSDHFAAPHDVRHLPAMVAAAAVLMADLVPGDPEQPVVDPGLDRADLGAFAGAATALPRTGPVDAPAYATQAVLGRAAFDTGDYTGAMKRFSAAADAADGDPGARATLLLDAGAAAVQAGHAQEAGRLLTAALEGFRQTDDALGAAQASHNLAVVAAGAGEVETAKKAFQEADDRSRAAAGSAGRAVDVIDRLGRSGTGTRALRLADGSTAEPVVTGTGAGGAAAGARRVVVDGARPLRATATADQGATAVLARTDLAEALAGVTGAPGVVVDEAPGSVDLGDLLGRGATVVLRDPLAPTVWSTRPLAGAVEAAERAVTYTTGVVRGSTVTPLSWSAAEAPRVEDLLDAAYRPRLAATSHRDLRAALLSVVDVSVHLAHLYYYVVPVGLAEAYAGLGEWATARTWLYRAADYPYLNTRLEGPVLWARIARTHLDEGDTRYKEDEPAAALAAYGGVVAADGGPGDAPLRTHPALAGTGTLVAALLADPAALPDGLDPGTGALVLDVAARVRQLTAGLDWFGLPASVVPPFTFDYLQNASRFLAQQAQAAERDLIQFMERYDSGRLTRLQAQQAAAGAAADAAVAAQQAHAAQAEVELAQTARDLAQTRHDHAVDARSSYATMTAEQIALETEMAWYSSQNEWELDNPIPGDGRDIHEVIAADRHRLGEISRDHELMRMQQNADELAIAEQQAGDQVALSQARAQAAALQSQAAALRRVQAQELAAAFEASAFTPEVWKALADFMRAQAQRYLYWATRVARLMERAYEFDYDAAVDRVRTDYSAGAVDGMLGSDQLLADIDYFTYDRITRTTHKTVRASREVSLAGSYPFAFAGFRRTGAVAFDTLLADLERSYPGSYNHRIQAVEVEVVGLVPSHGLRGTLTNSGVSQYRALDGSTKWRLQNVDTMLLSSYARDDAVVFRPRPELLGVFEGVGMASGWTLRYPPHVNDVDYRFLVDVRVTFHFEAQFDRALEATVRALPVPAEQLRATTSSSLRNDRPDRFYLFTTQGSTTLTFGPEHLPHHHLDPVVRTVAVQLLPGAGPLPSVPLTITAPGGATADVVPDGDGRVASDDPALAVLAGADVLGEWGLSTTADAADRGAVHDVLLFVEYDFTARDAS
ncbi:hypothetical protein [Cellulomonas shaoxiangyii]|uniref:Tc toxin complex TcA C-terminal TcB-binding domain-containing protein n=1 Tax=Cellulomonas shaoxiangyii TaxID=2566013 RepID=A0A4P7SIS6_9CELL|nr:hypothetical protein [Cellulomonas shaoxiangyii]QCB93558.1 hypothetical protein E5225_08280 [Cellulomonas shaoxiangyii]TGY86880.1 hypothetical protein E5226_00600 [Cellulomonas shaoxiangyii]